MTLDQAAGLIRCPAVEGVVATWYELGAGSGTFTLALAQLLAPGSRIVAVDRDAEAMTALPARHRGVTIERRIADFSAGVTVASADGVLMANALHFVRDQAALMRRLRGVTSQVLIVEYADRRPNPWVPYPLDVARFRTLATEAGFAAVTELGSRRSAFGGRMYAALASA